MFEVIYTIFVAIAIIIVLIFFGKFIKLTKGEISLETIMIYLSVFMILAFCVFVIYGVWTL